MRAALHEAAKKREMRYDDMKKIDKGVRRLFHDDITVIVMYLDHHKGPSKRKAKRKAQGCTSAPVDIFSLNAEDEAEQSILSSAV